MKSIDRTHVTEVKEGLRQVTGIRGEGRTATVRSNENKGSAVTGHR